MSTRRTPITTIVASEALSTIGSTTAFTAAPLIAITSFDITPAQVGVLAAAGLAAPLIFGLSAGAIADRLNSRRALLLCGTVRLLLIAVMPLAFQFNVVSVPVLCVVSFGLSAIKLVFDSVIAAMIPRVVDEQDLARANGWMEAINSGAYAIGPALAGWLTQAISPSAVYSVSLGFYLASTLALRNVSLPPSAPNESGSHISQIVEGIRVLCRNDIQRTIAISAGVFNIFHSAFFTVLAIFLLQDLRLSTSVFGTLMSSVALIGLLAAMYGPQIIKKVGTRSSLVGSLLLIGPLGIPIVMADGVPPLVQVLIIGSCLATWDFLIVMHLIVEQTLRQLTVHARHLARITATTRFISWGGDPIGALLGGFIAASWVGTRGTLVICLLGFVAAAAVLLTSRSIRGLHSDDDLAKALSGR